MEKKPFSFALTHLVFVLAGSIFISNTFLHSSMLVYDKWLHKEGIQIHQNWSDWAPRVLPHQFESTSPLYYYLAGKLTYPFTQFFALNELMPFSVMRFFHLFFILFLGYLYCYRLLPKLTQSSITRNCFVLSLFIFPNLYLAQVMVRADHLLFLMTHLMFYLWFYYEFPKNLAQSPWRQWVWALGLIGLANSRPFALAAFLVFGAWGAWILLKGLNWKNGKKVGFTLFLALFIFSFSGLHTIKRYLRTGLVFHQKIEGPYFERFYELQKNFDRKDLFLNFEFKKLIKTPNRLAPFEKKNAFFPRLYGDMWADHWLRFSSQERGVEDKKIVKRRVLQIAWPFTLFYFLAPFGVLLFPFFERKRKKRKTPFLTPDRTAGLIWSIGLLLFITFVYREPEVNKNSTVKFVYLLGYYWLPFFCMIPWLDRFPKFAKGFFAYTVVLFLFCVPLMFYLKI